MKYLLFTILLVSTIVGATIAQSPDSNTLQPADQPQRMELTGEGWILRCMGTVPPTNMFTCWYFQKRRQSN